MKKVIIIALCILGICNAHAETMTAQEIILTEIATYSHQSSINF